MVRSFAFPLGAGLRSSCERSKKMVSLDLQEINSNINTLQLGLIYTNQGPEPNILNSICFYGFKTISTTEMPRGLIL